MAYKLIWSPASRDDLHDIVHFISRDTLSEQRRLAIASLQKPTSCKIFQRLDQSSLNTPSQLFARLLFDPTGLSTASITSAGWSRLREYGMRPEALQIYRAL